MTTTSFDDFSSEEWGPHSSKSRKSASRAGMMGLGAVVLLSATFLANGHYSVPFVQFIGSYSDAAAAPEASAKIAVAETAGQMGPAAELQIAGGRGDRVFTGTGTEEQARSVVTAKGDRVGDKGVPVDRSRLAYAVAAKPIAGQPSPERFLAPAHGAESARLSKALSASRMGKFAKLQAPVEEKPDAAAIQSLASAIGADIAGDMPHPSLRPNMQLASLTTAEDENEPLAQRFAHSIPVPTARPQPPQRAVRELASIASEAEGEAAPLAPALNPRQSSTELPEEAPLPKARPARRAAAPATQSDRRATTTLAYAPANGATDDGGGGLLNGLGKLFSGGGKSHLPGAGSGIAVYDISAATVYMPNGAKLEAHSGLGHMQDNPRYVDEKNKGPTPPNVYNLVMRENLFHGVQAIRLLPADGKKKFNRDGLLAHTYMYRYGDSSQSNGCVVFKDYKRFLRAFKQGRVTHMVVVPNMSKLPTYMAML